MGRAADLLSRLPDLYREGETLGRIGAVFGNQFEMLDETARDVRRSHFFAQCLDLEDAAKLGALLDIAPEPFQGLTEYRAWVAGLRAARLQAGSVTREGIRLFTQLYLDGFEAGNRLQVTPVTGQLGDAASDAAPALIENPPVARHIRGPGLDGITPLDQFTLENGGLDAVPAGMVITARGDQGGEFAPMIANLTTGEALVYLDRLPAGQRLFLLPVRTAEGIGLRALREAEDVSARIRYIHPIRPGDASSAVAAPGPLRPLTLNRGANLMWFLPLAHFDVPGLDRALLALADENLGQGRWDRTRFDHAVFAQEAWASLQVAWAESAPAAMELRIPTGMMRSEAGRIDAALLALDNLATALGIALRRLSAAGVSAKANLAPRREYQPMQDNLALVLPISFREGGSTGADRMPDADARFGVTKLDDATLG
ncbi:hypothetical protein [Paracoccus ravus]|uniref:hypothetical protein n=1 Tax=Paracoccus ravus TaxID=2447760 RepID=UPI00106DFE89|nr:hypothetical protein [Paracoccus ravus]